MAMTAAPLTITLFGPLRVLVEGSPLPHMHSRKALWLLALLALRPGRSVEREWLAGTLWPDADPAQAFASLRPVLSELRKALGDEAVRLQSPSRSSLLLDLTGAGVDVSAFDAAITSRKLPALERAVGLYVGPLLEGCAEEWVPQERAAREQDFLQALQTLAEAAFRAGDPERAAGYHRRVIALDPWREASQRGLMEALAQGADSNGALQVYREFVALLRSDPRAVPDGETSALYARLRSDAKHQATESARNGFATIEASVPVVSGHLHFPLTALIGREDEREEVAARLKRSRLVTLTGPGGIGKTRLAIEVASEAVAGFADGAWLVALDSLTDRRMLSRQIATLLGLKEEPGRACLATVTDHLRAKRLLLVLDNCEHLLEESAQVAGHLLRECVGIRILATSREALGITGETAWMVPPLSVPDPAHLPAGQATLLRVLMSYEGVQLFVERAQAVQKAFSLKADNARLVAQVCFRLEGIPLAIELAAARVRSLTAEQIAARLDDHLGLLTGGSRGGQSRQQTLRATIDWSYDLLDEAERALLRRLSAFAGGWSLEAAEQVCSEQGFEARQVLDLLTGLVDKSLVLFSDQGMPGKGEQGSGRYRLQETVRQYAAERLTVGGEAGKTRTYHRDFFLGLAEEAEPHLWGAARWVWLRRLEAEHDNLRAALAWCEADAEGAEAGLRLAGALWQFWSARGDFSEGRGHLHRALARPGAQRGTATHGWALKWAGKLADSQGDYAAARALHEQCLGVFQELGDKKGIGSALGDLNDLAHRQGDAAAARVFYEQARSFYEEYVDIIRRSGDKKGAAREIGNLGILAYNQGDYAAARAFYEEGLGLYRELGDRHGSAMELNNLGEVAYHQGDFAAARALYEQCLGIFSELGAKQGIAHEIGNLGFLASQRGDYAAARALYEQSLDILQELGDKKSIASTLNALVIAARGQGDDASARALQAESLLLCQEVGDQAGAVEGLDGMAAVLLAQEETPRAVRLWGAARALREGMGASLPPGEQEEYDRQAEQARLALGEDGFAAAWMEGRAMTWEQAVACALSDPTDLLAFV